MRSMVEGARATLRLRWAPSVIRCWRIGCHLPVPGRIFR